MVFDLSLPSKPVNAVNVLRYSMIVLSYPANNNIDIHLYDKRIRKAQRVGFTTRLLIYIVLLCLWCLSFEGIRFTSG